jgi:hypothetical protein
MEFPRTTGERQREAAFSPAVALGRMKEEECWAAYKVGNSVKTTNRARRFLRRHSSVCSKHAGASLP